MDAATTDHSFTSVLYIYIYILSWCKVISFNDISVSVEPVSTEPHSDQLIWSENTGIWHIQVKLTYIFSTF
jgi:hypothetical protein